MFDQVFNVSYHTNAFNLRLRCICPRGIWSERASNATKISRLQINWL